MSQYKCPFAEKIPLQCDARYSFDEFIRQMKLILDRGEMRFIHIGDKFECKNEPEMCPRYVQHLVANIAKYKQR